MLRRIVAPGEQADGDVGVKVVDGTGQLERVRSVSERAAFELHFGAVPAPVGRGRRLQMQSSLIVDPDELGCICEIIRARFLELGRGTYAPAPTGELDPPSEVGNHRGGGR